MYRHTHHILVGLAAFSLFIFFGLVVALVGGVGHNALLAFDYKIDHLVAPLRASKDLAQFMLGMTYMANPEVIIVFELCLLGAIVILRRKRIAGLFLAGIVVGELASLIFKDLFARARPVETIFHVSRHGYSFPSGHALLSIVFYGCLGFFLAHILKKDWQKEMVAIITAIIVFLIGFSRIYLGVHWASDVIGGWALGGAFLSAIAAVFFKIHRHRKAEKVTDLTKTERTGLLIIGLALGFFLVSYFVTHVSELRSIL